MIDKNKQPDPPTAEDLERDLLAMLLADRRRIYREYLEMMRWEKLMDEARRLLPSPWQERRP